MVRAHPAPAAAVVEEQQAGAALTFSFANGTHWRPSQDITNIGRADTTQATAPCLSGVQADSLPASL